MANMAHAVDMKRVQILAGLAGLVSSAILAIAYLFEYAGGFEPCALCLDQRYMHMVAAVTGIAGLAVLRFFPVLPAALAVTGILTVAYAGGTFLSFYHVGVEYEFWAGPETCTAGMAGTLPGSPDALMRALQAEVRPPACNAVPWSLAGISMAGYNMLLSAALLAMSAGGCITEIMRLVSGR